MNGVSANGGKANFDRIAYRVSEFAEMLTVSRAFLYAEKSRGNLAIVRVAGRAFILCEEAERYVRENLRPTSTDRAA